MSLRPQERRGRGSGEVVSASVVSEPIELLTGGEGAKAKEPEAWEAKGEEAEPS
jgi:hypothetical protein